jgi:NAD(P)-dependent dehydrogenase (short-subunit alcohol dehydrogenase family)
MAGLIRLLHQKYHPPALTETTFDGKTVLITGGTSGLGLEAAKKLAALNAFTVIITARDPAKGARAKEEIEFVCRDRAQDDLDIQVWPLDMSDFSSVRNFAHRVNTELSRLDVAILNAGHLDRERHTVNANTGPWELTLMVNTLATLLLGLLLLPKLLSTAQSAPAAPNDPPHLTFISSGIVAFAKPSTYLRYTTDAHILQTASSQRASAQLGGGSGFQQYAQSKLFLEYGMRRLAALPCIAKSSGERTIIVNSTCPGMCRSELGRSWDRSPLLLRLLLWVFVRIFARSADHGSRSYVSAVTRGVEGHGKMWKDDGYEK